MLPTTIGVPLAVVPPDVVPPAGVLAVVGLEVDELDPHAPASNPMAETATTA
jgi:hypothetical protein